MKAQQIMDETTENLIERFIAENPGVKMSDIEIVTVMTPQGWRISVAKKKEKPDTSRDEAVANAVDRERERVWDLAMNAVKKNGAELTDAPQPNDRDIGTMRGHNRAHQALVEARDKDMNL